MKLPLLLLICAALAAGQFWGRPTSRRSTTRRTSTSVRTAAPTSPAQPPAWDRPDSVDDSGPQAARTPRVPFNGRLANSAPRAVHEFLEQYNWGDFHMVFHMARKYYVMSPQGRRWLDSNKEKPGPFQEGDPMNGIEFLTMHRAMIEYLRQRFGNEPVTNDPDGRTTWGAVLDGWRTDEEAIRGLEKAGADVDTFRAGLVNINRFSSFKSEDEFGLFLQTSMRLQGTVDPANPSRRRYVSDDRPGSGVHNWLHGQLMDDSPITVGDPRTNLPNIMFWRIHGWIENKWKQFEAARRRTPEEDRAYQSFITEFRAHTVRMSAPKTPAAPSTGRSLQSYRSEEERLRDSLHSRSYAMRRDMERVETVVDRLERRGQVESSREQLHSSLRMKKTSRHVPWDLVYELRPYQFRNHIWDCRLLADGTTSDSCPNGNRSPGVRPPPRGVGTGRRSHNTPPPPPPRQSRARWSSSLDRYRN